jgi:RNA polymerase sigma factor (sigma-70 family)
MTAVLARHRDSGRVKPGRRRAGPIEVVCDEARLAAVRGRIKRLLSQSLEYRVCREFKRLAAECVGEPLLFPAHANAIDERTLLSAEQEGDLFVRMNYCKFRADVLRPRLPDMAHAEAVAAAGGLIDEIETCLATAARLRDCLVRAFLKLAVSLIGPFVSRRHGFEELFSEAAVALLRAVEKFDPDRGFRFSTYATPAVRRQLERFIMKQHKDQQVLLRTPHLDTALAPPRPSAAEDRRRGAAVEALEEMLTRLDAREQSILRARFGLQAGCDTQSLQEVAGRLGVCRERVRQLEARALEKLRDMPEAGLINVE